MQPYRSMPAGTLAGVPVFPIIMFFPSSVQGAPFVRSALCTGVAAACLFGSKASLANGVEPVEALETIVVTATRQASQAHSVPAGLTVIDAKDIKRVGASSVMDALKRLGAIVTKLDLSNGGNDSTDLRGFGDASGANTVVLIDGLRISDVDLSAARLSGVPIDLVERIEIQRGGASVLWGEGASAGVINVILKKGHVATKGGSATIKASLDSLGGYQLGAATQGKAGVYGLDASVTRDRGLGYRANSAYSKEVYAVGLSFNQDVLAQQFRVVHDEQFSQWPGYLNFVQFDQNPRQSTASNSWGRVVDTKLLSNSTWRWPDLVAQLDASARYKTSRSATWGGATHGQQLSPKITKEVELAGWRSSHTLGVDYQHWARGMPAGLDPVDGMQINRAIYFFNDFDLASQTRITAGARREFIHKSEQTSYSAYERRDAVTAGEFGINQQLSDSTSVYVRAAKAFRLANFDENGLTPNGAPLLPQISQDRELGVKWRQGDHSVSVRAFRQNTTNEILYLDFDPLDFDWCCNRNIDPVRRQGVELESKVAVTDRVRMAVGAQALSARFVDGPYAGKRRVLVSPRSANVRLDWQLSDEQLLYAGMQYQSSSLFSDDLSNTCARRIPAQITWDAGYSFERDGWRLATQVLNLFDRKSYGFGYLCNSGALYPNPGQVIKASLSKQF